MKKVIGFALFWVAVGLVLAMISVSYTHLDVYKRQVVQTAKNQPLQEERILSLIHI